MTSRLLFFAIWVSAALVLASPSHGQRSGNDFELDSLQRRLETAEESLDLISIHLNLGDVHAARGNRSASRDSYDAALAVARSIRRRARLASDLTLYATATAYEGFAEAKRSNDRHSFELFEEAFRYLPDSAKLRNLSSTAFLLNGHAKKARAQADSAVTLQAAIVSQDPSTRNRLDLEIYRYSLASAEAAGAETETALATLDEIARNLASSAFETLREEIARKESFEIYSSVRGDADAYVSLYNRTHSRIARLREARGESVLAREAWERVLELRSDEPAALAALARLGRENRGLAFARAFDANPHDSKLVLSYLDYLSSGNPPAGDTGGKGEAFRRVAETLSAKRLAEAEQLSASLVSRHPESGSARLLRGLVVAEAGRNEEASSIAGEFGRASAERAAIERRQRRSAVTLDFLQASAVTPTGAQLEALLDALRNDRLTPEQAAQLDTLTLRSIIRVESSGSESTSLTSGSIEGVAFTFGREVTFRGAFHGDTWLDYSISGITRIDGRDALLIEPKGLSK